MVIAKNINSKIKGIKNIKKLTSTMSTVSALKMLKIQEYIKSNILHIESINKVIYHVAQSNLRFINNFFQIENNFNVRCVGYIIVSSDKGFCGNLNTNLFKLVLADINKHLSKDIKYKLAIIGSKGMSFFNYISSNNVIVKEIGVNSHLKLNKLKNLVSIILEKYNNKLIDRLFIATNRFDSVKVQIPVIKQLLPISLPKVSKKNWDYIYEFDIISILNKLIKYYLVSKINQSVIENLLSEQASRMVAMKVATDNSDSLIRDLSLKCNKIRQYKITQELIEVISGASAIL